MKKFLFPILMLCGGMARVMAIPVGDGTYTAGSYSELQACIFSSLVDGKTSMATIRLTADIYLSDGEEATLANTFSGTLDGCGHTIWAASPEVQHDGGGHYKRSYLFTYAKGATFRDLTFRNIREESSNRDNQAVIAQVATEKCVFENLTFDHVSVWCKSSYAGAVAGRADDCTFSNITITNSDFTVNDNYAGAVVGEANACTFTGIVVRDCDCTADDDYAGGVTGQAVGSSKFENVQIQGGDIIAHSDYAGGITGNSTGSDFKNCSTDYRTRVYATDYSGGMIGNAEGVKVQDCANSAIVGANSFWLTVAVDCRAGGIIGRFTSNTEIESCINAGVILAMGESNFETVSDKYNQLGFKQTTFQYAGGTYIVQELDKEAIGKLDMAGQIGGGIVGFGLDGKITYCANLSPFYFYKNAGGIAGHLKNGVVECCTNYGYNPIQQSNGGDGCAAIVGDCDYGIDASNCLSADPFNVERRYQHYPMFGNTLSDTKVSNCLNTVAQITSSNAEQLRHTLRYETTPEVLASGIMAYWLNNTQENLDRNISPWRQTLGPDGDPMPTLDPTHPVVTFDYLVASNPIRTPDELIAYAEKVNAGQNFLPASLACDITMPDDLRWLPIGDEGHPFIGVFEGNGHTIDNVHLASGYALSSDVGLFGVAGVDAEIRNVVLGQNSAINTSEDGAAGILGAVRAEGQTGKVFISGCGNEANITASYNAAGIVGRVFKRDNNDIRLTIEDCYSTGRITSTSLTSATKTGESAYLCAYSGVNATIRRCWAMGRLSSEAGGYAYLPNEYFANIDTGCTVEDCYTVDAAVPDTEAQPGVTRLTGPVSQIASYILGKGDLHALPIANVVKDDAVNVGDLLWFIRKAR